MGLIKTAILAGAGTHAVNKLVKAQEEDRKEQRQQADHQLRDQSQSFGQGNGVQGQAPQVFYQNPNSVPSHFQSQSYDTRAPVDPVGAAMHEARRQQEQPGLLSDDSSKQEVRAPSPRAT